MNFRPTEVRLAWLTLVIIIAFYAISLISLATIRPSIDFGSSELHNWHDVWLLVQEILLRYLKNTMIQASLSATLILGLAYTLAKALGYLPAKFKYYLLTVTNASFSLPTILVVFAIITILGRDGWVNSVLDSLGVTGKISVYGLVGIVLANAYFNIGYTATAIYNNLAKIPLENVMLARQCNLRGWQNLKYLELPYLKSNLLNLWLLMFMLCFNSFALLLFLGGGPKYANFEVAIYNSLISESDFVQATMIAVIQIIFSLILITIISLVKPDHTVSSQTLGVQEYAQYNYLQSLTSHKRLKTYFSYGYAVLLLLYIGLPLVSLVVSGIASGVFLLSRYWQAINSQAALQAASQASGVDTSIRSTVVSGDIFSYSWTELLHATYFSFIIAIATTITCVIVSIVILRGFRWTGGRTQLIVNNFSLLGLAIPNMLLGAGYYMLVHVGFNVEVGTYWLVLLIVVATSFSSLAYSLNYLAPAYKQLQSYGNLGIMFGLSSWQTFYTYEFSLIRQSLVYASVNIFVMALGDFSIILFFVNDELTSLTYLLATQLGGFSSNQGNITALALLAVILSVRFFAYYSLYRRNQPVVLGAGLEKL